MSNGENEKSGNSLIKRQESLQKIIKKSLMARITKKMIDENNKKKE